MRASVTIESVALFHWDIFKADNYRKKIILDAFSGIRLFFEIITFFFSNFNLATKKRNFLELTKIKTTPII